MPNFVFTTFTYFPIPKKICMISNIKITIISYFPFFGGGRVVLVVIGLGSGLVGPVGVPGLVGRAGEGEHASEVCECSVASQSGAHL